MRSRKTVTSILNHQHLNKKFVVARGWEKLPEIEGDLDLFVRCSDWLDFEMHLSNIAREHGWDELILDRSWDNGCDHSSILVFYFRMKDGGECLQVDLFNGYSILGCGYLDANLILQNSITFDGVLIPSMDHFKRLRKFQIYRHLKWFSYSHNHKVIEYFKYFQIDEVQNAKLKLRIAVKRLGILIKAILTCKKISIIDRVSYYTDVLKRFRHDAIYDGETNRKEWISASNKLLKNKYTRNCLIISKINIGNVLKALRVIERNGILVILKNKDVYKIDSQDAIDILIKLKLNQSHCIS